MRKSFFQVILWLAFSLPWIPLAQALEPGVFATVNGIRISQGDYLGALQRTYREKFYHFRPPPEQEAKVRREVGEKIIADLLIQQEIVKRNVQPDAEEVKKTLEQYDAKYANSPQWQATREKTLPALKAGLEEQSRRKRFEAMVRAVTPPAEAELRAYYEKNIELFTEPQQNRAGLILLRVDPSSAEPVWEGRRAEAAKLIEQIRAGADFGKLAKEHSQDGSASNGGDLGYLHKGMVSDALQAEFDKLQPGEAGSAPITLLEGVAVAKLLDRKASKVRSFEEASGRARDLWLREKGDKAWADFVVNLVSAADVKVNEALYEPGAR